MVEWQAPVLEMLWEAQDPHHILDGRFGFSEGRAAGRWVADTLDVHWGFRIDSCERIVMRGRCRPRFARNSLPAMSPSAR